jgi:hypothetical protein
VIVFAGSNISLELPLLVRKKSREVLGKRKKKQKAGGWIPKVR